MKKKKKKKKRKEAKQPSSLIAPPWNQAADTDHMQYAVFLNLQPEIHILFLTSLLMRPILDDGARVRLGLQLT